MKKYLFAIAAFALILGGTAACTTKADTVNHNLDKDAESFKIVRKIQFVNGITDKVLVEVTGRCPLEYGTRKYDVTCKVDDGYVRNTITKSDNSFVVSEQLKGADVSDTRYKFIVRPGSLIPDVDVQ